eukprot:110400_1
MSNTQTMWSSLSLAPADPIMGLKSEFKGDGDPRKVNLGIGAYRNDQGESCVLDCVRKAEEILVSQKRKMDYLPILGCSKFLSFAVPLPFGEGCPLLKENRVVAAQTISGTGALRVAFEFLSRHWPRAREVFVSDPTYANHAPIIGQCGLAVKKYRYYAPATRALDFEGMIEDLKMIPPGSIVLLQTVAHNPTGVDPTHHQWRAMAEALKGRHIMCVFDTAYQGFATADFDHDAFALRHFVSEGMDVIVCYSFAKNMALYGQRGGFVAFSVSDEAERVCVESQLKLIIRRMYSNPPIHPAWIVTTVLTDAGLKKRWFEEVKIMADRMNKMRVLLRDHLEKAGSSLDWDFLTKQVGMFSFTGLSPEQVARLKSEFHVYASGSGRISFAPLTPDNVKYVAESIHAVTK